MHLQKGMNKKGQLSTWETIGAILLVGAIVVGVVLFFTGSLGNISDYFGQAPEAIELKIPICQGAADSKAIYTFCDDFKEVSIGPQRMYANCQYSVISDKLQITQPIECKVNSVVRNAADRGKDYCGDLLRAGLVKADTRVNDQVCSSLTCKEMGGAEVVVATNVASTSCNTGQAEKTKEILTGYKVDMAGVAVGSTTSVCCVKP